MAQPHTPVMAASLSLHDQVWLIFNLLAQAGLYKRIPALDLRTVACQIKKLLRAHVVNSTGW